MASRREHGLQALRPGPCGVCGRAAFCASVGRAGAGDTTLAQARTSSCHSSIITIMHDRDFLREMAAYSTSPVKVLVCGDCFCGSIHFHLAHVVFFLC